MFDGEVMKLYHCARVTQGKECGARWCHDSTQGESQDQNCPTCKSEGYDGLGVMVTYKKQELIDNWFLELKEKKEELMQAHMDAARIQEEQDAQAARAEQEQPGFHRGIFLCCSRARQRQKSGGQRQQRSAAMSRCMWCSAGR